MDEAARMPRDPAAPTRIALTWPTTAAVPPFGIAVAIGLLCGVAGCLRLPALPPAWTLVVLLSLGLAGWWRLRRVRWLCAALVGLGLAGLHAAYALSVQLPHDWEQREVRVAGRVVQLPEHQDRRTTFSFRVDGGADHPTELQGRLLQLAWYDDFDGTPTGRDRLHAGQRWVFSVRLRAPRGLRNPGRFDSEKHALADRVTARGHVREPHGAVLLGPARGVDAWRERMSGRIAGAVPSAAARFVRALALGDTRGLSDDDWQVLRANGLTHLIAISGFHVGLVAGFAALLASAVWWLLPALGRRWPRPVAMAVAGLAGALGYAAVSGFALPTLRTVLMIAVVAGVRASRRSTSMFEALALAAIAILLFDPLAILGAGFWLSFFGVAWLLWCLPDTGRRPVRDLLSAQGVATVGLLPLGVALFGEASLAGPLANLVAVPWWSLVVVPLSLLGTLLDALQPGWGGWAWRLAAWCFELSWPLFERFSDSGLALWWLPEPRWFALPLAMLGAFWLLLPRGLPGRPLALLLWLPLLWPDRNLPSHGEAELQVLDVGQGMSILVRTAGHALLYDMGPATPGYDAGARVVLPALRAAGVRRLDRAVASHGDSDHAGGFGAVVAAIPVGLAEAPDGAPVEGTQPCVAGTGWEWDGVAFRYLHPTPHFPYLGNEASCVLRVSTPHGSALLTGDIGKVIERGLVRRADEDRADAIRAEVVLVAHHGSGSASDPMFVEATGARHALVSNGHGNRFGHPRADVVSRWEDAGASVLTTAEGGALSVRLAPGGPRVETRRAAHPRLWDDARRAAQAPAAAPAGLSYRPE